MCEVSYFHINYFYNLRRATIWLRKIYNKNYFYYNKNILKPSHDNTTAVLVFKHIKGRKREEKKKIIYRDFLIFSKVKAYWYTNEKVTRW